MSITRLAYDIIIDLGSTEIKKERDRKGIPTHTGWYRYAPVDRMVQSALKGKVRELVD